MKLRLRRTPILLLLAAAIPFLSACSSNNTISFPTLAFEPAATPAPMTVVVRNGSVIGSDVVELEIVVTGVTDVFAVDMTMTYDSTIVRFLTFSTTDTILGSDGTQTTAQVSEQMPGTVTMGLTRIAGTSGVDVADTETELLFRMQFVLSASAGAGTLSFDDDCLRDSSTPPMTITGVTCSGGTFRIS